MEVLDLLFSCQGTKESRESSPKKYGKCPFSRTFVHQLLSRYYHENMFVSIGKIVNIFAHEKGRSSERPNPRKYLVLLHFSPILVRHLSDFSPALVGDKTGMRVTVLHRLKISYAYHRTLII